jgi:hypothetical protein
MAVAEIDVLRGRGWYEVCQLSSHDAMFEGELSTPSGHYLFHPSVVDSRKEKIRGIPLFFGEDYFPFLAEAGLAVDLDDPVSIPVHRPIDGQIDYTNL